MMMIIIIISCSSSSISHFEIFNCVQKNKYF